MQAGLEELERRKGELESQLAEAPSPAPRFHPNFAGLYRRKVADLHQALADSATRAEAIEILCGLTERIELRPVEGGYEIDLVGEIAKMIELSAGAESSKVPAYASSAKVVAGPTTIYTELLSSGRSRRLSSEGDAKFRNVQKVSDRHKAPCTENPPEPTAST